MEGSPKQFSSPQEEIAFLRSQIAERERGMLEMTPEIGAAESEAFGRQELNEYSSFTPKMVLHPEYELLGRDLVESTNTVETAHDPVQEIINIAKEKGIKNALTVMEKASNAFTIDEVHRQLVEMIKSGVQMQDLREDMPPWQVLHMTLYEVTMPAPQDSEGREHQLGDLMKMMEQLFSGLRTIGSHKDGNHFVIEIAVADKSDDIIFYVSVPNEFKTLFEKQALSLFPDAILSEQVHDYNVFVDGGHTHIADIVLKKHPIYPLKNPDEFAADPLQVILNAFSQIERDGGGAALQFVVQYPIKPYNKQYS